MSPAPTPVQNTVVVDSETESESEIESHPDNEFDFYVGNQLGLPSPPFEPDPTIPPFDPTISNELNSEFFPKEWFAKTDFTVCQTACKVQVNETEGNEFEVMETNIEVSLVRRSLSMLMSIWCWPTKSFQNKTKIDIQVEDSSCSKQTINIKIEHVPFRGRKHEREFEGVEKTTNIHIQVKKARK